MQPKVKLSYSKTFVGMKEKYTSGKDLLNSKPKKTVFLVYANEIVTKL
jgi:CRISPR/Cas system CMR-associated protein Cmr3 (group 5 of RAMP superfamily)